MTESIAYRLFPTDQVARKEYLQDFATAVVKKMTARIPSASKLLDAIRRAASKRRIRARGTDSADQQVLEGTEVRRIVPGDDDTYAQMVINNFSGNNMNYYLKWKIEYAADGRAGDTRNSTDSVRPTNTATDRELPDYVADLRVPAVKVAVLGNAVNAASNGKRILPDSETTEHGDPILRFRSSSRQAIAKELSFLLSEPTSAGEPRVTIQPLIDSVEPKVSVPVCT